MILAAPSSAPPSSERASPAPWTCSACSALGALGITTLKLLGTALTAQGRPLLETAGVAVAFVTVFALDFLLIPAHGGLGASIASAASYILGGVAVAVIFARALGARRAR